MNLNDLMGDMNENIQKEDFCNDNNKEFVPDVPGVKDERFYNPKVNDKKDISKKVRLLPSLSNIDGKTSLKPFLRIKTHNHSVKRGDKKPFINTVCPTTFGKHCPICSQSKEIYGNAFGKAKDKGLSDEQAKELAKTACKPYWTKDIFITNALITEDDEEPGNVGKVMLYKYGPLLSKMISEQMNPSEQDIKDEGLVAFNPWDWNESKDFRLSRIDGSKTDNGFHDWKASKFVGQLSKTCDSEMIQEQTTSLDEFLDEERWLLSDEELLSRLDRVIDKPSSGVSEKKEEKQEKKKDLGSVESAKKEEPKSEPVKEEPSSDESDIDDLLASLDMD